MTTRGSVSSLGTDVEPIEGAENDDQLTMAQAWCIYTSHFLSMWNSRIYEFGGVLFAQHAFPGTLLATSLIGVSETICIIASSAALGQWIDASSNRLRPLITSIIVNRIALSACCAIWIAIAFSEDFVLKQSLFAIILILGMAEKTTRMSNMLSMERDWIPVLAGTTDEARQNAGTYSLTHLNTVIRRIDIICKFLTPLAASVLMAVWSNAVFKVPLVIGGYSLISLVIEVLGLRWVWDRNSRIRSPKSKSKSTSAIHGSSNAGLDTKTWWLIAYEHAAHLVPAQIAGLKYYFSTGVWVPSFGVAILHASVLDWAGTLITWLLNAGFTYGDVTIAKGVGTIFEIGSTFVFPLAVSFFARQSGTSTDKGAYQMVSWADEVAGRFEDDEVEGNGDTPRDRRDLEPIVKAGSWGISSLFAMLVPAVMALSALDRALVGRDADEDVSSSAFQRAPISSSLFFTFLSFSFVGRWVYDLSVTQLTQCSVLERQRSEFGGAEMALVAMFQLGHWIASAIWREQGDFKWLGVMSLAAVAVATGAFWKWYTAWKAR